MIWLMESEAADATLTALAALATAADKLPYFTGVDRAALTALTSVGRAILSKPSIQSVLNYLGLGEAANGMWGQRRDQIPDMGSFTLSVSGTGYQNYHQVYSSMGSIGTYRHS